MTILTETPPVDAVGAPLALDRMAVRLEAILDEQILCEDAFVEITAIYNNASYLLLYLDANDEHQILNELKPLRTRLYEDPALDARILGKLCAVRFQDESVEMARQAYVRQLCAKANSELDPSESTGHNPYTLAIEHLREHMLSLEERLAQDRRTMLERIGFQSHGRDPATLFYHIAARTNLPATREKLARLWSRTGAQIRDQMVKAADDLIAVQRDLAVAQGASCVLEKALERCQVGEDEVAGFLDDYLRNSLEHHLALEKAIVAATGSQGDVLAHFGHLLHVRYGGDTSLLFDLDACLNFAVSAVRAVFALDLVRCAGESRDVIVFSAHRYGEPVGRINLDIWADPTLRPSANHTLGIRNRACWRDIVQRPEAWVKCHFPARLDHPGQITFQNVHSLFHEFGHAVNHLLLEGRVPNRSGLEFMPLERLECLSMWFEKWVYHPDFINRLGLSGDVARLARLSQAAKKAEYQRTYLERAVTASLDFECRRRSNGGLREAFATLDARHRISNHVAVEDLASYFAWPMFMTNPGANFSYLWGAAWSCAAFEPFLAVGFDEAATVASALGVFDPCMRAGAAMMAPDPKAIFRFYAAMPSLGAEGSP